MANVIGEIMRDKEEMVRTALSVTMDNAFETGEILKASEETLQKYLWHLCTEGIDNERVRHRAIVRALTINHIQMQRHIDKLNKRNTFLQWLVISLAILAFIATGYQIYIQRQKSIEPLRQERLNTPSASLEPKDSISKTSKEPPRFQSETTSINKQAIPLKPDSKSKAYEPPK
jgi:hypothetical protein